MEAADASAAGGPSDELMEYYARTAATISEARAAFLDSLTLAQPSAEEAHYLRWTRDAEEAEVARLAAEVARLSAELEARGADLAAREATMEKIRRDQRDDRVKIQRLVALCQPVVPDITFVVGDDWTRGPTPTRVPPPTAARAAAAAAGVNRATTAVAGRRAAAAAAAPGDSGRIPQPAGADTADSAAVAAAAAANVPAALCTEGYAEYLRRRATLARQHASRVEASGATFLQVLRDDEHERAAEYSLRIRAAEHLRASLERRLSWVEATLHRATGDSLTLRHNVRTAHAADEAERKNCAERKRRAEAGLAALEAATEARRRDDRAIIERRLEEQLAPLRGRLVEARDKASAARAEHARHQRRHRDALEGFREKTEDLKRRHAQLHHRRAAELAALTAQLAGLRRAVARAEAATRLRDVGAAILA